MGITGKVIEILHILEPRYRYFKSVGQELSIYIDVQKQKLNEEGQLCDNGALANQEEYDGEEQKYESYGEE